MIMKVIELITDKISGFMGTLGGLLVILLMLLVSFGTVSRYGFGEAYGWITDLGGYSMFILVFLGAAQVQKNRGHVSMDLFVNMLGKKAQNVMGVFVSVVSALLSLTLFWYGFNEVLQNIRENAMLVGAINVPKYYILIFLPVGFLLLASYFFRDIVYYFKNFTADIGTKG